MIFTHTYQANYVRCSNPLMIKVTDVVYIALRGSIFTFSDSLPAAKSNTGFGKITLMALEESSFEIEENLVYLCFGLA